MAVRIADEGFDAGLFAGCSCAFGVFDGLHAGHRFLLDRTLETASGASCPSLAITFDIDPDEVFHPRRLRKLMCNDMRIEALEASGVDCVVVLPFTSHLYSLDPAGFLARCFCAGAPAHMHVGKDFRFGAKASGTARDLGSWGNLHGCKVHAHHLVNSDGAPITSTRIRELLAACDLPAAYGMLGHRYTLRGTVEPGRGEGTGMGFATANLEVDPFDRVLGEGVYTAYANVQGARYKAAVSVGVSPTFHDSARANVEVHILGFVGDIVGETIDVEFVEYLRPMRKFASTEELVAAVRGDIARAEGLPLLPID